MAKRKSSPDDWEEGRCFCFVRHAQALHNVCDDNLWTPDNPLTPEGEQQCQKAHEEWGRKIFDSADLVIVSPMTRALQTAYLIGGLKPDDKRILVSPACAEHLSGATCDEGRPLDDVRRDLPWAQGWRGFAELSETWWTEERPEEALRVASFLRFLQERSERRIVVVSHGAFLGYIVGYQLENAQNHIMTLEDSQTAKKACERSSFNIGFAVIRQYEDAPLKRLAKAPLTCLQGLGRKHAAMLASLGPKTVNASSIFEVDNIKNEANLQDILQNGELSAELTASCQCVLRFFHATSLKYCTCHEKVRPGPEPYYKEVGAAGSTADGGPSPVCAASPMGAASPTASANGMEVARRMIVATEAAAQAATGAATALEMLSKQNEDPAGRDTDWFKLLPKPWLFESKSRGQEVSMWRDLWWTVHQYLCTLDNNYEVEVKQTEANLSVQRDLRLMNWPEKKRSLNRSLGILNALMAWGTFDMKVSLLAQITKLEDRFKEYDKISQQPIGQEMKFAILLRCVTGQLRMHLNVNLKEDSSYEALREMILQFDRANIRWTDAMALGTSTTSHDAGDGAVPMHIDRVKGKDKGKGKKGKSKGGKDSKGKGKSKGDGKAKGKVKGKSKDSGKPNTGGQGKGKTLSADTCKICGEKGHWGRECPQRVRQVSQTEIQAAAASAAYGKSISGKGGLRPPMEQVFIRGVKKADMVSVVLDTGADRLVFERPLQCPTWLNRASFLKLETEDNEVKLQFGEFKKAFNFRNHSLQG
eukprot:s3110_g2.t1